MLAASWEVYIVNILIESVELLSSRKNHPKELPEEVKDKLSQYVKTHKHNYKLSGDGWKAVYHEMVRKETDELNTPKSGRIKNLFRDYLGIKEIDFKSCIDLQEVDKFVLFRGRIAHKVKATQYVKVEQLKCHCENVTKAVKTIDEYLLKFLSDNTDGRQPWNIKY